MQTMTKDEIEKDARMCAQAQALESDCQYPEGTAAHCVWMQAYKDEVRKMHAEFDAAYEFHNQPTHVSEDAWIEQQQWERGYNQDRYSRTA